MFDDYLYTQILGGLYGLVLGDAWAMPAYPRPEPTWSYFGGWPEQLAAAPADHPWYAGFQAGQITPGAQQALALLETLVAEGQLTVANVTQTLVDWYDRAGSPSLPLIDLPTVHALAALKAGADPNLAGLYGDTCSAALRSALVGLVYPGNPMAAAEAAVVACRPTHQADVAVAGACAMAAAVARALAPETTLDDIVAAAVQGADVGLLRGTPWLGISLSRRIEFAIQLASEEGLLERDRLQNLYDLVGATPAAADAVPCAFGILVMAQGNPVEAAVCATALSGHASAVAALAGVVAGTWYGLDATPPDYIEILRQANPDYDFERIAAGLYELALRSSTL